MAVDKLVDSTQLDADLTTIANAIRTKGGTSAQLAFPQGMADAIAAIPSGGITPSGKKLITDTSETDVAAFATAQISSDTLLAENIKKNVNILGVVGSFEGGGGGSLPSSISKIDGGSFTPASDTFMGNHSFAHNLGTSPVWVAIWTKDNEQESYSVLTIRNTAVCSYGGNFGDYRKTDGSTASVTNIALTANDTSFSVSRASMHYKAGCTYKWLAWA